MTTQKALTEARAQLIWGTDEQVVAQFLLDAGLEQDIVDDFIAEINIEKNEDLRSQALRKVFLGAGLLTLALVGFALAGWQMNGNSPILFKRLPIMLIVLGGVPGLFQFINGYMDLLKWMKVRRQFSA